MTARKRMLIQKAQRAIAKHHENLDFETKQLYMEVQYMAAVAGQCAAGDKELVALAFVLRG